MRYLDTKTIDYAYPYLPWQNDEGGFYFPDFSIHPFIDEAISVTKRIFERHLETQESLSPLNRHRLLIAEPNLSWEESCNLVIEAFTDFHPKLGEKAKEVIQNQNRWKVKKTSIGEAKGCCHPANCETNSTPYAIIEYEYDETINDAVYIAHELGHLIADDFMNKAGFSYSDGKRHMNEVQAFFTQHILYAYLSKHPDTRLKQVGQSHFIGEITRSLYSLPIGIGALEAEKAAIKNTSAVDVKTVYESVLEQWLGDRWTQYNRAVRLANEIQDPRKRDDWGICNLHQHPMASIIATGVFTVMHDMSANKKQEMIDALLNLEGPKGINDIFEAICNESGLNMQQIANLSIQKIESSFDKSESSLILGPKEHRQPFVKGPSPY